MEIMPEACKKATFLKKANLSRENWIKPDDILDFFKRRVFSTRPDTRHKSFAVFVSVRREKAFQTDGRTNQPTNGRMDGWTDGRTDGWTHPLIES